MQNTTNNFWEAITTPPPFYTEQNVTDTAEYAKAHPTQYTEIYIDALRYVILVITRKLAGTVTPLHDVRMVSAAIAAAEAAHDKSVHIKDFRGAVRWLYIKAATRDFLNFLKKVQGAAV